MSGKTALTLAALASLSYVFGLASWEVLSGHATVCSLFAQVICGPLLLQARLTKRIGLSYKCIRPAEIQSPISCRPNARGQGAECPMQLGVAHSKSLYIVLLHRDISLTPLCAAVISTVWQGRGRDRDRDRAGKGRAGGQGAGGRRQAGQQGSRAGRQGTEAACVSCHPNGTPEHWLFCQCAVKGCSRGDLWGLWVVDPSGQFGEANNRQGRSARPGLRYLCGMQAPGTSL